MKDQIESDRDWNRLQFEKINEKLTDIQINVATLNTKSGFFWGVLGGATTLAASIFFKL